MWGSNCHSVCIFMTELLFFCAALTVDIMVSSEAAAEIYQVPLSSCLRPNQHSRQLKWTAPILMWCMCKADPSVGHQNRRVKHTAPGFKFCFAPAAALAVLNIPQKQNTLVRTADK